jgi:hypothetical protein
VANGRGHEPKATPSRETAERARLDRINVQPGLGAALAHGSVSRMPPDAVSRLQRHAGNRALSRAIGTERLAVQRHDAGAALLPGLGEDVSEIEQKKNAQIPPGAALPEAPPGEPEGEGGKGPAAPEMQIRSAGEKAQQQREGKAEGTAYVESQALTPSAMSLAASQKILQGRYGDVKTIVPGNINFVADNDALQAQYDKVAIGAKLTHEADGPGWKKGDPWKTGDCAKEHAKNGTSVTGFAFEGTVYVNAQSDLVTTTAHEMLHLNAAKGFRETVGTVLNEGATERLAAQALKDAGINVDATLLKSGYFTNMQMMGQIAELLGGGQGGPGDQLLYEAYFNSPTSLVKAYEKKKKKKKSTWKQLVAAAQKLDLDTVKAYCQAK